MAESEQGVATPCSMKGARLEHAPTSETTNGNEFRSRERDSPLLHFAASCEQGDSSPLLR